jgi:GT2 family glycosyltransferase
MEVSIIYVNWNSVEYLRESIASVYEHTRGISFEIIVVDNASPTAGVDDLKEQFAEIMIVKSQKNLGFAGANNLGFKHSSGAHILFLNPDTKLISPAIQVMSGKLQELPNAGIVGCKLLNADLSIQTSCIQTFPTILNQVLDSDYLRNRWPNARLWGTAPLYSDRTVPASVEVISGACLMIDRDTFEKVGMFTEEYFMYAEDLDLCYQVRRAGRVNYYVGDATVIHYGGTSSVPQRATVMKWKAILRFCKKTRGPIYGFAFRLAMSVMAIVRLCAIAAMSLFGNIFGKKAATHSVFAKWGAILRTLLTPTGTNG